MTVMPESVHFCQHIWNYNNTLSFTSLCAEIDRTTQGQPGVYTFRISGNLYHNVRSVIPTADRSSGFAQIYVIGGNNLVEAMHRIRQSKSPLLMSLMMELQQFLTTHNSYAKFYCNVQLHLHKAPHSEFVLKQVIPAGFNRKISNKPSVDEVAMVVESSNDASIGPRDILLQKADGEPVKITNQHSGYLALWYPILFPYGQPNWVKDVASSNGQREHRLYVPQSWT
jgi:hypothetical protein